MQGPNLAAMAWRNLWRNRRRTLITVASIALGGCLAVLFTAMQDRSFADFIDTAARLGGGHVTIQHPEYLDTPTVSRSVTGTDALGRVALADPRVKRVLVRINAQTMVSSADDSTGAFLLAFDPGVEDADTLSLIDGLVAGERFRSPDDSGVILGSQLAERLRVGLGNKVVYTLTDKQGELVSGMGRVQGLIRLGNPGVDGSLLLLPLNTARRILGYGPHEATRLAVFVSDARRSAAVAASLAEGVGPGATAYTWEQIRPELSAFVAMKIGGGRFMELLILVLVAAGIFNTLLVSVLERSREFGVMRAIGFARGQLFRLVMWESLWLGLVGLAAGAAITAGPYFYLVETGIDLSGMMGNGTADVGGVGFDPQIRVGIFPENLAAIVLIILGATLLTGLYPARRAGKLEPVEAIRLV